MSRSRHTDPWRIKRDRGEPFFAYFMANRGGKRSWAKIHRRRDRQRVRVSLHKGIEPVNEQDRGRALWDYF